MAPSFLKDIRRRSKSSFRTSKSTDSSFGGNGSNGSTAATNKSSSTLSSIYGGSSPSTPALTTSMSAGNLQKLNGDIPPVPPLRPSPNATTNNRYSVQSVPGMSGLGSPSQKSTLPASQFAPRILSISDNTWVYCLHIHGGKDC